MKSTHLRFNEGALQHFVHIIYLVLHCYIANIRPKILGGGETLKTKVGPRKYILKSESGARPFNNHIAKRALYWYFFLDFVIVNQNQLAMTMAVKTMFFKAKKKRKKNFHQKKKFHPDLSSRLSSRFKKGVVTLLMCVAQDEILDEFFPLSKYLICQEMGRFFFSMTNLKSCIRQYTSKRYVGNFIYLYVIYQYMFRKKQTECI